MYLLLQGRITIFTVAVGVVSQCLLLIQGSYQDYIQMDEEVQQLVEHISKLVKDNGEECKVRSSRARVDVHVCSCTCTCMSKV